MTVWSCSTADLYFADPAAMIRSLITVGKTPSIQQGQDHPRAESLMKLAPQTACVCADGDRSQSLSKEVHVGDLFLVRP